jgi:hypothetical protein
MTSQYIGTTVGPPLSGVVTDALGFRKADLVFVGASLLLVSYWTFNI